MKVAVIGSAGVIGSSNARMFGMTGDVVEYDPRTHEKYPLDEIISCDFAVICVGTPMAPDGSCNLSFVWTAVAQLPKTVPILIRSTVMPRTTDMIAKMRRVPVAFCPEFLYERGDGPWNESADVPYMILGGDQKALDFFTPFLEDVHASKVHWCKAVTAELAKYTINLFWATKVTFVNEMSNIAHELGADWEDVRDAWVRDPRVDFDYTRMEGFPPGFGGACWPKDLSALIAAAEYAGYYPGFLRSIRDNNARFTLPS